jgi:hypothetical protein
MASAISQGLITPGEAEAQGFKYWETDVDKFQPMPERLYHVTTARSAVLADRLRTRQELGEGFERGLGGGTSKMISFTDNPELTKDIFWGIVEMRKVARGEITVEDMLRAAEEGRGTDRPFLADMLRYWKSDYKRGDPIPQGVQQVMNGVILETSIGNPPSTDKSYIDTEHAGPYDWQPYPGDKGWMGGDSKMRYSTWQREASPKEKMHYQADFYKIFASHRQHAGGAENPLFFGTDVASLSSVPEQEIAILEFKAKPGSLGVRVEGLDEWRTPTGEVVDLVREVPPDQPKPSHLV